MASQAQATSTQRPPPIPHARYVPPQPPAKRQKTASGWRAPVQVPQGKPRPPVAPGPTAYSLEDLDLPEISVRDGFYGVQRGSSQDLVQRAVGGGGGGGAGVGASGGMKRSASSMSNASSGNPQQAAGSGSRTTSGGSTASGTASKPAPGLQRTRSGLQVIGSYIPQQPAHVPTRNTPNHNQNPNSSRQPLSFVNAQPPHPHPHPQPQAQHQHYQQPDRPVVGRVTSFSNSGPRLSQGLARHTSNPSFHNRPPVPAQQTRKQSPAITHEPTPVTNQSDAARKMEEELAELRTQFEAVSELPWPFMRFSYICVCSNSFNGQTRRCKPR